MFLDYFALGVLIFVALVLFYGIIAIHDIPYEIAKARKHPQQDALHVAGWISLFTLHAIWPFLWIWATLYREDRGWGFQPGSPAEADTLNDLRSELNAVAARLAALEQLPAPPGSASVSVQAAPESTAPPPSILAVVGD